MLVTLLVTLLASIDRIINSSFYPNVLLDFNDTQLKQLRTIDEKHWASAGFTHVYFCKYVAEIINSVNDAHVLGAYALAFGLHCDMMVGKLSKNLDWFQIQNRIRNKTVHKNAKKNVEACIFQRNLLLVNWNYEEFVSHHVIQPSHSSYVEMVKEWRHLFNCLIFDSLLFVVCGLWIFEVFYCMYLILKYCAFDPLMDVILPCFMVLVAY